MNAEQLRKLLRSPHDISSQDVNELHGLLQRYPYFQAGYALLAKAAQRQNSQTAGQAIQLAAIYATDRSHLEALLEEKPPFAVPVAVPKQPFTKAVAYDNPTKKKTQHKHADFINDYVDKLRQKREHPITNQKSLEQQHLIQNFMEKEVRFKPQSTSPTANQGAEVDFTQKSAAFHDDLATESLAQVLVKQGNIERALAIYDKLSLKFPEKRSYFATLIKELKRKL